jgi:hypothetical protein
MGLLTRSDGNTQARNGWFRRKTKQPKHNVLASPVPRPSDSAAPPCSTASPPPPYKQLSTQQVDGTDAAAVAAAADDDDIATTATAADAGETPEPEESAHVEQPSAPIGNMIPVDGRESSSSSDVAAPTGLPRTISAFRRAADIVPTGSDASASTEDCLMPRPSLSPNTASLSLEQWRQKKQAAEAEEAAEKAARLAHLRGEGLSEEAAAPTSGNPFRLSGAGPVALAGDGGVALSTSSMSANPFHAPQQLQPDVAEPTELTLTDPQLAQEVSPAEQSEQSAGTQDVQGRTKQIVVTTRCICWRGPRGMCTRQSPLTSSWANGQGAPSTSTRNQKIQKMPQQRWKVPQFWGVNWHRQRNICTSNGGRPPATRCANRWSLP